MKTDIETKVIESLLKKYKRLKPSEMKWRLEHLCNVVDKEAQNRLKGILVARFTKILGLDKEI